MCDKAVLGLQRRSKNLVKMTAEEATVASTEKALEAAEEKKSLKSNPEDPSSAGVGFDFIHFYCSFSYQLSFFKDFKVRKEF